jgi:hypothetical protein
MGLAWRKGRRRRNQAAGEWGKAEGNERVRKKRSIGIRQEFSD